MTEKEILAIEGKLGYTFRDRSLLLQAFTRPSYVNEKNRKGLQSYQVLEFFGDSVLSCALATLLIRDFATKYEHGIKTKFTEGDFSVIKSHLSDKTKLSETTATLGLGQYLLLGEGDIKEGIDKQPSVLEDLYESLIGAIYIDSGNNMQTVTRVVESTIDLGELARNMVKPMQSFKNQLQEYCADKKHRLPPPVYTTLERRGEEHQPTYLVECRVGELTSTGEGSNTQKAQTASAEAMLALLSSHRDTTPRARTAPDTHPADTPASQLKRIADKKHISLTFTPPVQKEAQGDFFCTCTCGQYTTEGQGKSKAEAKQQSATKMLKKMRI